MAMVRVPVTHRLGNRDREDHGPCRLAKLAKKASSRFNE